MVLHTHQANPHVYLAVRAEGRGGKRLNPRKRDLRRWREVFAEKLRGWGIEAEAWREIAKALASPEEVADRELGRAVVNYARWLPGVRHKPTGEAATEGVARYVESAGPVARAHPQRAGVGAIARFHARW